LDPELSAEQLVDELDLRAGEEGQGDRVDQGGLTVALDAHVVRLGRLDQFEAVLEAGAAAAVHRHAQHQRAALGGGELGQAAGGACGQSDGFDAHLASLYEGATGRCKGLAPDGGAPSWTPPTAWSNGRPTPKTPRSAAAACTPRRPAPRAPRSPATATASS